MWYSPRFRSCPMMSGRLSGTPARARLAQIGRPPPFADGQIAAIAVTNGLVLVTFNRKDYDAFEELRMEDWRAD
jgi:predicted nucleic acid-binding protein